MQVGDFIKTKPKLRSILVLFICFSSLIVSSCSPERILMPPGDIVSSVRPLGPSVPSVSSSATIAMEQGFAENQQQSRAQEQQVASLYSPQPILNQTPRVESDCQRQLRRLGVRFDMPAPVKGPGACGIAHPVKVKSLSGNIDVVPDATLNCPMALAFAKWVKGELAGAARTRYLSGIKSIHQMSSYSCRTMNSKRGAPLSEHAKGNAIDIGKIALNNGKNIVVKRPGLFAFREKSLLNNVRAESCKYFTTVLGPGSDVHHRDHFHFDLRYRKSGYRHCDL